MIGRLLRAMAGVVCSGVVLSVHAGSVPAFSSMPPGGGVTGWEVLKPAAKAANTRYTLVQDNGRTVLKAEAERSMSGLVHAVRVDVRATPLLRWTWKVSGVVASADMTTKAGDDYAVRIYVMFDYPADKLSFGTRARLKLAESVYGQQIPTAALNYVWDNLSIPLAISPLLPK